MSMFHEANERYKQGNFGYGTKGYMEGLYRQAGKLPQRPRTESFNRALNFHVQQKERMAHVDTENERLRKEIASQNKLAKDAAQIMKQQRDMITQLNSKITSKNGAADDSRSRSASSSREHVYERSQQSGQGSAGNMPRDVLRPVLPNSSGHSSEHSNGHSN